MIQRALFFLVICGLGLAASLLSPGCKRTQSDNDTRPVELYRDKDLMNIKTEAVTPAAAKTVTFKPKGGKTMTVTMTLTVQSKAFGEDQAIPRKYTGEGEDKSPPLAWSGAPEATKEFALICDDPDAPMAEPFVHWVIYKIPADTHDLPEGVPNTETLASPAGALQGKNSFPKIGYGGPLPPRGHGVHHYHFKVYALNATLDVKPGLDKKALLRAMGGHVLAEGELIGTYERK